MHECTDVQSPIRIMRGCLQYWFLFFIIIMGCQPQFSTRHGSPNRYVNPFIGTGFHGHTFPGATLPHGRVQLSPDTHIMGWDASSGYHYDDSTLYGFSHTHLSGTGIGDMGDFLFLPYCGDQVIDKPVAVMDHRREIAEPGYSSILRMCCNPIGAID